MRKIFVACLVGLFVSLLFVSFGSAKMIDYKESVTITKYYPDDDVVVTHNIYANYDNDERFSTYDYRHGYSYRTSEDYWEDKHEYYIYDADDYPRIEVDYHTPSKKVYRYDSGRDGISQKSRYYDYHPYLKEVEIKDCYNSAPRDRTFYIKCPN